MYIYKHVFLLTLLTFFLPYQFWKNMNSSGMVVPEVHEYEVLEDDELDNITVDCAVSCDGTWKSW